MSNRNLDIYDIIPDAKDCEEGGHSDKLCRWAAICYPENIHYMIRPHIWPGKYRADIKIYSDTYVIVYQYNSPSMDTVRMALMKLSSDLLESYQLAIKLKLLEVVADRTVFLRK